MAIQVIGHGFELTDSLKNNCVSETREKLESLALHNFTGKWMLSLDAGEHVAHLVWADGPFQGDATVRSGDMYGSIHACAKKAMEQLKKAHEKRYDHHRPVKIPVSNGTETI